MNKHKAKYKAKLAKIQAARESEKEWRDGIAGMVQSIAAMIERYCAPKSSLPTNHSYQQAVGIPFGLDCFGHGAHDGDVIAQAAAQAANEEAQRAADMLASPYVAPEVKASIRASMGLRYGNGGHHVPAPIEPAEDGHEEVRRASEAVIAETFPAHVPTGPVSGPTFSEHAAKPLPRGAIVGIDEVCEPSSCDPSTYQNGHD